MSKAQKVCKILLFLFVCSPLLAKTRLKDISRIRGIRSNRLIGYGVVVGLAGTGDSETSLTSKRAIAQMMTRVGMPTKAEEIVSGNYASVIVTADLLPFSKNGDHLDVRVSVTSGATSLAGGTLLSTALRAENGLVYAVASGSASIGSANGVGSKILTVAQVPKGAIVEREFIPPALTKRELVFSLNHPDFTTAYRVATSINKSFKGFYAKADSAKSVRVEVPEHFRSSVVSFIASLENLEIGVDVSSTVIVNERTGTIVIGGNVTINPVAIAHGDLSVEVSQQQDKQNSVVDIQDRTMSGLIRMLNLLGVKPHDLVSILQAMSHAGAINGELKFM